MTEKITKTIRSIATMVEPTGLDHTIEMRIPVSEQITDTAAETKADCFHKVETTAEGKDDCTNDSTVDACACQ